MDKDYTTAREEALKLYHGFSKIQCPALGNEFVYFTSEGFNHLVYKEAKKPRPERVQMMRFDMLKKARFILETSTTFQEYEEGFESVVLEKHGKRVRENVVVCLWGFIAIVRKFRIKVVVRQIGNGNKHFYSVIPAWFTKHYRGIKYIETSTGLLEEDGDEQELKNATLP